MFVSITHPHKCKCLAKAPSMGEGRSWWVGELTEKLTEYPHETHCLHLRTQFKDVTFLCDMGDFQQLQVLCRVVTGKLDDDWIESMIKISKPKRTLSSAAKRITEHRRAGH